MMQKVLTFSVVLAAALSIPAFAQEEPIEPVHFSATVVEGVDLVYTDPKIKSDIDKRSALLKTGGLPEWTAGATDLPVPVSATYTDLRRGLTEYKARWASLPQVQIPHGASIKLRSAGKRITLLRERLGAPVGDEFDVSLEGVVREYQAAHGLTSDGIVGNGTIDSLNVGAAYYERLIILNMERARRLPAANDRARYIIVDAGAARLYMYENGTIAGAMNVIVGDEDRQTPMVAAELRYLQLNPYWDVPPDLARSIVAKRVLEQGLSYLTERDYEVLADSPDDAAQIDASTVDWRGVFDGRVHVRLRRGPGIWNSMGAIKFIIPNPFGIYLHDVPSAEKAMFDSDDRWISNGCIRLQDAHWLEKWLIGDPPTATGEANQRVDVAAPVPVYITYFTVAPGPNGVIFRLDRYKRDAKLLDRVKLDGGMQRMLTE